MLLLILGLWGFQFRWRYCFPTVLLWRYFLVSSTLISHNLYICTTSVLELVFGWWSTQICIYLWWNRLIVSFFPWAMRLDFSVIGIWLCETSCIHIHLRMLHDGMSLFLHLEDGIVLYLNYLLQLVDLIE